MDEGRAQEQPAEQADETAQVPLHVAELVRWCISLLATSAWQAMGLIPDPSTQRVERRFDDARLAIDSVAALLEHLRPRLDETERREFETLLANLRLNFVEQQSKG